MSKKSRSIRVLLTDRALADIKAIEEYSTVAWGRKTAAKYIDDVEAALDRLKENPKLLQAEPSFHPALRFYQVNKHIITCDVQPGRIVVLTVLHASMDIPNRLGELTPTLAWEVEMLTRKLNEQQK